MTEEKFNSEFNILKKFFEFYCKNKHEKAKLHIEEITYKKYSHVYELNLCNECISDINYCINKLQNCIHEEKPKCRKCKTPCYDKMMWKKVAKIMKYSGIHLKINAIKRSLLS